MNSPFATHHPDSPRHPDKINVIIMSESVERKKIIVFETDDYSTMPSSLKVLNTSIAFFTRGNLNAK